MLTNFTFLYIDANEIVKQVQDFGVLWNFSGKYTYILAITQCLKLSSHQISCIVK